MDDRRNPYLILGLDFGASAEQASVAFARRARALRRGATGPYTIEDATWALHQIERAETDHSQDVTLYRVPADASVFDVEAPPAEPLPRAHPPDPAAWEALEAAAIFEILEPSLQALAIDGLAYGTGDDVGQAGETVETPAPGHRGLPPPDVTQRPVAPSPPSGFSSGRGAAQGWTEPPTLTFGRAIAACIRNYASFEGRASRSEFWYFALIFLGAGLLTSLLAGAGAEGLAGFLGIVLFVLVVPFLAAATRRLHDAGYSGHMLWVAVAPYIGWLVLAGFLAKRGDSHPNAYG